MKSKDLPKQARVVSKKHPLYIRQLLQGDSSSPLALLVPLRMTAVIWVTAVVIKAVIPSRVEESPFNDSRSI